MMSTTTKEEVREVILTREPFTVRPGMVKALESVLETKVGLLKRSIPRYKGSDIHITTGVKAGLKIGYVDPAHVATSRTHIPVKDHPDGNGLVIYNNTMMVLDEKRLRKCLKGLKPNDDLEILQEKSTGAVLFRTRSGTVKLMDELHIYGKSNMKAVTKARFFRNHGAKEFIATVKVDLIRKFYTECTRRKIRASRIACSPEGLEFLAYDGVETVIEELKVSHGLCKVTKWNPKHEPETTTPSWIRSLFSVDYAKAAFDQIPSTETITIRVGHDWPMTIEWAHDGGHTYIMLAPQVDRE